MLPRASFGCRQSLSVYHRVAVSRRPLGRCQSSHSKSTFTPSASLTQTSIQFQPFATFASPPPIETTALQVTDPLLIYRAKVARGELEEDEEQLRALIELRNINRILRDYIPPAHLLGILSNNTLVNRTPSNNASQEPVTESQSREQIGELVKWLSESESLAELGTPKGLLITGTPGTGKSMVMDLFYDSLPTSRKFRRHYHHLLLDLYRIVWEEAESRRISVRQGVARPTVLPKRGTGVIWKRDPNVALDTTDSKPRPVWRRALEGLPFFRPDSLTDETEQLGYIPGPDGDVVKTTLPLHAAAHLFFRHGHILLFDEIQLVDVASAGLLRRTLEAYWRLGGVVIGTSNRIPKDLYASNVQQGQITQFLEILQERCPNFEMKKSRDFRRDPFYRQEWVERNHDKDDCPVSVLECGAESSVSNIETQTACTQQTSYFIKGQEDQFQAAVDTVLQGRNGEPSQVEVYGRKVHVPFAIPASEKGPSVCRFPFEQLCDSPLGPADYLTLASSYHTFIIDHVPQLTLLQKNQARRLITLLDAVYEAGCQLILIADAGPDDLFFPDARKAAEHAAKRVEAGPSRLTDIPPSSEQDRSKHRIDVWHDEFTSESLIQAETLSEAMQDTDEGFRPNVVPYFSASVTTTSALSARKPPPAWFKKLGKKAFSTSCRVSATVVTDHYKTLDVSRNATKIQIKTQFYKLSKKFHPDVNPSDDAKHKFQQVSEAYATLGSDPARKEYDRQTAMSMSDSGSASGTTTTGYYYDPADNANRRARATYAWDYQRRQKERDRDQFGNFYSSSSSSSPSSSSYSFNGSTRTPWMFGSSDQSHFERLAKQNKRREEKSNDRARAKEGLSSHEIESSSQGAGASILRFVQIGVSLFVIFQAGSALLEPKNGSKEKNPRR